MSFACWSTRGVTQDYNKKHIKFSDHGVEYTIWDHNFKKCPPLSKPLPDGNVMVLHNQELYKLAVTS